MGVHAGAFKQRARSAQVLLPQKPLIQPPDPVVTFSVFSHAPGIEEFTQVRRFCIRVFYEPLAYGLAVASVPGLFVEMLTNCGSDTADRCFASASAHDRAKANEARNYVLALNCRALQAIKPIESRTAHLLMSQEYGLGNG